MNQVGLGGRERYTNRMNLGGGELGEGEFKCEEMHRTARRLKKTDFGRIVSSSGPEKMKLKIKFDTEDKTHFLIVFSCFKWSLPPCHSLLPA